MKHADAVSELVPLVARYRLDPLAFVREQFDPAPRLSALPRKAGNC